ncbi:MAG: AMP-binding protein, partial [Sphaerochaeta sp.]|nr:AMP-binding protein [Sphaerochaeta sp.]
MERTIVQMLHDAAAKYADRTYTNTRGEEGWIASSFSQTDRLSDYVAAFLVNRGFKAEQAIAILSEGKGAWVTCEHGIVKARMVSVPLSIKLTAEEIAFRVNHSEAVAIAVSSNTLANVLKALPLFKREILFIYLDDEDARLAKQVEEAQWKEGEHYEVMKKILEEGEAILKKKPTLVKSLEKQIKEDDVINICYTSGTTGNPKGIMLTHVNYWVNVHDAIDLFKIPEATFETLI